MKAWIKGATCGVALTLIIGGGAYGKSPTPTAAKKDGATCGDYGTSFYFDPTPADAAKAAKKDGKLVMVLHISGHFEDPGLT